MPIGVITNCSMLFFGGLFGSFLSSKITAESKEKLNLILGLCSICMGIKMIIIMEDMPVVILSIIVGTIIGQAIHLGDHIKIACLWVQCHLFTKSSHNLTYQVNKKISEELLLTAIVLFCASGTGIYGALIEGMTGDYSILLTKSILDFFTAAIFAASLGLIVSSIVIPQCIIFILLFLSGSFIVPLLTTSGINNFRACGGIIMLATGLRMCKIKDFPIADMIPAMMIILVWAIL